MADIQHIGQLKPDPKNARSHNPRNIGMIVDALHEVGAARSIVIDENYRILAGNGTIDAAAEAGIEKMLVVPVDGETIVAVQRTGLTEAQKTRLALYDNRASDTSGWDAGVLAELAAEGVKLDDLWVPDELDALLAGFGHDDLDGTEGDSSAGEAQANATLAERFVVPPFSVLDARQGYWQTRHRAWHTLGIDGEDGRGARTFCKKDATDPVSLKILDNQNGQSVFDPVLCELAYRWFCPAGGLIVNPMAGESVYGLVAAYLGYRYTGVEIREEQVISNRKQAEAIGLDAQWIHGDGRDVRQLVSEPADFIMCCPPYFDLEVYSNDPNDLSTREDYKSFLTDYRAIIAESVSLLKPNRFACFTVSDIRDKKGFYRGFTVDTIRAFEDAGAKLYNEAILVHPAGTLPLRAGRQFSATRKLGRTHESVLIFCKGDPKRATLDCGDVEVGGLEVEE